MNSRQKGKRGELELAKKLKEYGFETRRSQQFSGIAGDGDVVELPDIHIEVKRVERLNIYEAIEQAVRDAKNAIPTVFHRKNGKGWLVTMQIEGWVKIYKRYLEREEIKR
ncbi:MAG: hypothetical protein GX222_04440 [Ruminococcaceae bacterium]|nr:hypothetical protein [Oscillospiraceae bacterium]